MSWEETPWVPLDLKVSALGGEVAFLRWNMGPSSPAAMILYPGVPPTRGQRVRLPFRTRGRNGKGRGGLDGYVLYGAIKC